MTFGGVWQIILYNFIKFNLNLRAKVVQISENYSECSLTSVLAEQDLQQTCVHRHEY